ncbi:MAG TPA: class I SAM-dependent methyltransferase [Gammaproteobacteria bacterium]|nr:class I SAM-dependent methyltransferase [Gammaproteobacteria bacterium]
MEEAEFDKFAAEYRSLHAASIKASGESPEYFAEYKIVDVAAELARARGGAVERAAVLDFGAGVGYSVPFFARHMPGARVTCLDVSQKSLDIGAARHGSAADFRHFDGKRIPYADRTFDVALASCVFHHIPHDEHVALLAEIRRVLKDDGLLLVFEHNPLNPLTRHAVNTCIFDEHAVLVRAPEMRRRAVAAGFAAADVRYRIFFPHWARSLRPTEKWLTWLPLGAQYYVRASKRSGG